MGCNCGKKNQVEFVYTSSTGKQETHKTLMSARAAQIRETRAGSTGGSIREVEKK